MRTATCTGPYSSVMGGDAKSVAHDVSWKFITSGSAAAQAMTAKKISSRCALGAMSWFIAATGVGITPGPFNRRRSGNRGDIPNQFAPLPLYTLQHTPVGTSHVPQGFWTVIGG